MKRILSLVLCALMVVTIIPMTVAAEGEELQKTLVYSNESTITLGPDSTADKTLTETVNISSATKVEISFDVTFGDNRSGYALTLNGKNVIAISNSSKETRIGVGSSATDANMFYGLNNKTVTVNATIYMEATTEGAETYNAGDAYVALTYNGTTKGKVINVLAADQTELGETIDVKFGAAGKKTIKYTNTNIYVYEPAQQGGEVTPPTTDEVKTAVWVDGYQKSAVVEGVYNVRFAMVIDGFFAGQDNVGVEITTTAGGGKRWDLNTNKVYRSLTANFGTEAVTAEECDGEYITAAAIEGVPAEVGVIEFVITPYVTVGGVKVYGETKTVTVDPAAAE